MSQCAGLSPPVTFTYFYLFTRKFTHYNSRLSGRTRTYNNPDSKSGNHTNGSHLEIKKPLKLIRGFLGIFIKKSTHRNPLRFFRKLKSLMFLSCFHATNICFFYLINKRLSLHIIVKLVFPLDNWPIVTVGFFFSIYYYNLLQYKKYFIYLQNK